jgi:hypothetical protein
VVGWLYLYNKEGYTSGHTNNLGYFRLGDAYNTHMYSPSLAYRCAQGEYTYTSNPQLLKSCKSCNSYASSCNNKALQGRPFVFDYSNITTLGDKSNECNPHFETKVCGM